MKKVLVLGAGMVAKPLVRYLLDEGFNVLMLTRTVSKAEKIIANHPRGEFQKLDVATEFEKLDDYLPDADLAISLLPYTYHVMVAERCIKYKKHMVTTSYVSDAMRAVDERAKEAGIIILNEIGLDPGIDHMSAMKIIHRVQENEGEITSFNSYCCGLPAPEANTNPWGYKFSWSPRGVVLAARNNARYLKDGQEVNVPWEQLFENYSVITVEGIGDFEAYPNRDSIPYIETYGISTTETMIRWTLRYPGWCKTWKKIGELGLLGQEERNLEGLSYRKFLLELTKSPPEKDAKKELAQYLKIEEDSEVIRKFEWLGLLSEEPLPFKKSSALDVLVARLLEKLQYEPEERDMIILYHKFLAKYGERREKIRSTLVDFGIPGGDSAMSRTVGLPAAIGTKLILEGKIGLKGVCIPVVPEIYEPVLKELEQQRIIFQEKSEDV